MKLTRKRRYRVVNTDITLIAQAPKLSPHYAAMKSSIAKNAGIDQESINIKAATTEKLGWIGRGQGMAAMAVVLLSRK